MHSGSVIQGGVESTYTFHNALLPYERGQGVKSAHLQTDDAMLSQNLFEDKESVEYVSC